MIIEAIVDRVARYLKMRPDKVRSLNFYNSNETTYYNSKIYDFEIKKLYADILKKSDYEKRCKSIEEFNKNNKFKKRGISIIPGKHGVGFPPKHLNQGAAIVSMYTDGSM